MTRKMAVFGVALCALFAFGGAYAAPEAMNDANDRPGDWKLDFKNADAHQIHSIQFVRMVRPRDAAGIVKYDVIQMSSDPRYPLGLWDTYLGNCNTHATADIWMGEVYPAGEAKGAPSVHTDFVPEIKHTPAYDTLEKMCSGAALDTVQDPIATGREFLKR